MQFHMSLGNDVDGGPKLSASKVVPAITLCESAVSGMDHGQSIRAVEIFGIGERSPGNREKFLHEFKGLIDLTLGFRDPRQSLKPVECPHEIVVVLALVRTERDFCLVVSTEMDEGESLAKRRIGSLRVNRLDCLPVAAFLEECAKVSNPRGR